MIQLNSDVVFIDASGQVRSLSGDLTLRAGSAVREIIVGSGASLRPEQHQVIDLGRTDLRWRNLHAMSGTFTQRPSVNGSGVLLQGEDRPLAYASYVVNEASGFVGFGATFTPARWNNADYEDSSIFSRATNNERIVFARTGLYKVTYSAVMQKTSSGAGTIELEMEINNSGATIRAARGYTYHGSSMGNNNISTSSKCFIRQFNAGDFIELQAAVISGGGNAGFSDGTAIVVELLKLI